MFIVQATGAGAGAGAGAYTYLSKLRHAEVPPVAGLSLGDRLQLLVDVDVLRAADGEGEGVGVVAPLDVDGAVDADAGVDIGELRPRL
jgi:hypothetical protein